MLRAREEGSFRRPGDEMIGIAELETANWAKMVSTEVWIARMMALDSLVCPISSMDRLIEQHQEGDTA